jgi:hypothetical protein
MAVRKSVPKPITPQWANFPQIIENELDIESSAPAVL